MIKKLLFLVSFSSAVQAQFIVSPNPFNINSGTITITYGSSGNYTLFDPMNDQNLYLYTGLETDGVASTWDYHDNFMNTTTQTPLTYNATLGYYVATLNIGTRSYLQEPSLISTTIPSGINVNNWYFLIKTADGVRQSADLIGTNFGFVPLALSTIENNIIENEIQFCNDEVHSKLEGETSVIIFNILGQKIKNFVINQDEKVTLKLDRKNIFIALISNKGNFIKKKFIN